MKEMQNLLKMVSDGLKTLAQGVEAIAEKIDEAATTKSTGAATPKKQSAPVKKAAAAKKAPPKAVQKQADKPATAIETVWTIISRSKKGVDTATIREKTGYNQKKVSNMIYKLKKQGKIKSIQKGVYVKL
jgi:uncharacterized membrane protein